jgi:hypothetical protein
LIIFFLSHHSLSLNDILVGVVVGQMVLGWIEGEDETTGCLSFFFGLI